jgi:DNA-binding transcriptional regulator YiaG
MADSEFWRDLALKFRTLSRQQDINGLLAAKRDEGGKWVLLGNYSYRAQFGALASRGAKWLGYATDLIDAWMRALMAEHPDSLEIRPNRDVLKICGASADVCEVLEARAMESATVVKPQTLESQNPPEQAETVGEQIRRLRTECRLSGEELAEATGLDPSNVSRHETGASIPTLRHLGAYDRAFSKLLRRQILIHKTPSKRNQNAKSRKLSALSSKRKSDHN